MCMGLFLAPKSRPCGAVTVTSASNSSTICGGSASEGRMRDAEGDSTFQTNGVEALLMGGQACVFHGAAQVSSAIT